MLKQLQEPVTSYRSAPPQVTGTSTATATEQATLPPVQTRRTARRFRLGPMYLSRRQEAIALTVPVAYAAFLTLMHWALRYVTNQSLTYRLAKDFSQIVTLLGAPILLCLWLGWRMRCKRAGAFAGAWLVLCICLVVLGPTIYQMVLPQTVPAGAFVGIEQILITLAGVGAALGTVGAMLGQWLRGKPTRPHDDSNR